MHIVHVVRQFAPSVGGLEDVVAHLARQQTAAGDDVTIVTLDRLFQDPACRLPARERIDGLDVARIPYGGSTRYPIAPGVLRALAGADLVHVHGVDFFFDFLAWTRPWHRKPLVATTHGGFFHTPAHARLKRLFFRHVTRRSAARYDAVVACSESDAAMFGAIADNVIAIENGVDIAKFADCASASPVRRLATIGRFSDNKRLDRVLDVLSRLVAAEGGWHLDVIGTASDWTERRLADEIAARGLGAHVDVHLGADAARVRALLGRASLFLSASTHEGFGLVLIEAASAGLACVVEANAAFAALAPRLPGVHLAAFADPAAAADTITRVYEGLGDRPREAVDMAALAPFAWPGVAARYGALYRRVLRGRASGTLVAPAR